MTISISPYMGKNLCICVLSSANHLWWLIRTENTSQHNPFISYVYTQGERTTEILADPLLEQLG